MEPCTSILESEAALNERAVQTVMQLYNVSREDAIAYFWDEVEAAERLLDRFEQECA